MKFKNILLLSLALLGTSVAAFGAPSAEKNQEPQVVFTAPNNWTEQRSALLIRRYQNEVVPLRHILGLYHNFRGYVVESVAVVVRGGLVNSSLDLVMHGYVQQSILMPQGRVLLFPRTYQPLGLDMHSLQLGVRGLLDIESVTVTLREEYPAMSTNSKAEVLAGERVTVPVFVGQRFMGQGTIDLTRAMDMNRYRGYRIEVVEVSAYSPSMPGGVAFLDLLFDGMTVGFPIQLTNFPQIHIVQPGMAIIGRNVRNIGLQYRGSMEVQELRFRLVKP
jgi:hypothetical protein